VRFPERQKEGTPMRMLLIVPAVMCLLADDALADVIDGIWCQADGRTLSINGPTIVTPGGHTLLGEYGRHFFSYAVPESEPNAGTTVVMQLVNETTVYLWTDGLNVDPRDAEVWRRCQPIASVSDRRQIPLIG
jgi:hypothetical protein